MKTSNEQAAKENILGYVLQNAVVEDRDIVDEVLTYNFNTRDLIEELVANGSLVQVECTMRSNKYTKTFLMPRGTQVHVINGTVEQGDEPLILM